MSSDTSTLPSEIKVLNLAIGVSDTTNNTLNFDSTQYLIVGEKTDNYGTYTSNIYSLLVDEQGVAINTSFNAKSTIDTTSALLVDGNVYITGNILGPAWGNLVGSNFIASNTYIYAVNSDYNQGLLNLYTTGNLTLGNITSATGNSNTFNIVKNDDTYSINKSQFSLQNLQLSQLRMAIIGNSQVSPIIFNTPPGTGPLEFHMSRDQGYFSNVYSNHILNTVTDIPYYDSIPGDAPHFRIDQEGNVGIKTSVNRPISFNLRVPYSGQYSTASNSFNQPADLQVEGVLYASNIVTFDYVDGNTRSLDDIYIRRIGQTILASQIMPGTFGGGDFTFQCNLFVNKNETIQSNLYVNGDFSNAGNAYFTQNVDIGGAIFMNNAYYKTYLNGHPCNVQIQFQVALNGYSNINYLGLGITTPGIFGAGIDPNADINLTNQLISRRRNPTTWELELTDETNQAYTKTAVFGHPTQDYTLPNFINYGFVDGSLVIATPSSTNTTYASGAPNATLPQNIYLFPGRDPNTVPFLTASTPPTLAVFSTNQVGINTYVPCINPATNLPIALTVNGDILYTNNIYNSNQNGLHKIATFYEDTFASVVNPSPATYTGIQYINSNAAHVGINTVSQELYGLVVAGKMKSLDGYYTPDDHKVISWYDGSYLLPNGDISSNVYTCNIFAWGNVGIGVPIAPVVLSVKDNSGLQSTAIQLVKSDTDQYNNIIFQGANTNQWELQTDHYNNTFSIGNDKNPLSNTSLTGIRSLMIKQNPLGGSPQMYIATNINGVTSNTPISPDPYALLTVGGNMAVLGDVNITGAFRINSQTLINSNIIGQASNVNSNQIATDVYIGGRYIQLDFNTDRSAIYGRGVVVGTPFPQNGSNVLITQVDKNIAFRVYSAYGATAPPANQLTPVATFQSAGSNSIIEFVALSNSLINSDPRNQKVSMGLFASNVTMNQNYNFAILDGSYNPYLSFYNIPNSTSRYTGVNNLNPQATFHIQASSSEYGSNMFRLTKPIAGDNDTTAVCPSIDLQKTYTTRTPTTWTLAGPNAAWNQKLSFLYSGSNISSNTQSYSNELFTFANNGCIGIGSTQPIYSLDIGSVYKQGSIRLWDAGSNTGLPQLLFQTGMDDIYGDNSTLGDYRMATSNGYFIFDTQSHYVLTNILKVAPNGHIGVGTDPSQFNLDVGNNFNVGGDIYIKGTPIATLTTSTSNLNFNAPNISFNAYSPTNLYGSVAINQITPTSNLFYIHSGVNQNMLVLDSDYQQAQIHFRTTESGGSGKTDVFRMDANTSNFEWKYYPNYIAPIPSSPFYFNDCNTGYSNAFSFGVSPRSSGVLIGDFDTNVYGSVLLNSTVPNVIFGPSNYSLSQTTPHSQNNLPAPYITASNNALIFVATCNIGIGTYYPQGVVSIYNSPKSNIPNQFVNSFANSNTLLRIDQYGYGDILNIYAQGSKSVSITSNGFIGIGTSNPSSLLTIQSSNITQTINVLAVNQLSSIGNVATLYNSNQIGLTINNNGYIGINSFNPQSNLHVNGDTYINGHLRVTSNVYLAANIEVYGNSVVHGNNITDSDKRIKTDLTRIESGLEKLKKLTGYTFTNIITGTKNTGLIAQDVEEILPEAVDKSREYMGVAYGNLMGLVVEAIKELSDKVDSIQNYINIREL